MNILPCLISILALPIAALGANVTTTASRDYVQSEINAATTNIPFESIEYIKRIDSVNRVYYVKTPASDMEKGDAGFGCGSSANGMLDYEGPLLGDKSLTITMNIPNGFSDVLYRIDGIRWRSYTDDHAFDVLLSFPTNESGIIATREFVDSCIDSVNTAFSNAVLEVGLNVDTNTVAVLNDLAASFGGFPIEGTATTIGGILAALAAAVVYLKKNKADKPDGYTVTLVTKVDDTAKSTRISLDLDDSNGESVVFYSTDAQTVELHVHGKVISPTENPTMEYKDGIVGVFTGISSIAPYTGDVSIYMNGGWVELGNVSGTTHLTSDATVIFKCNPVTAS